MKARQTQKLQETEPDIQVETKKQQSSESNGPGFAAASLSRVNMPPAGETSENHHTKLVQRTHQSNPVYSQQVLHQLQRSHGNRYVQRIVDLSRKGTEPAEVDRDIEQNIQSKRGAGRAMDNSTRQKMESGFGRDFSSVRVHNDSTADDLNKSINARAFTTGSDVFFRNGEYQPGSSRGRELLAHELTHVVQQGGSQIKRQNEDDEDEQIEKVESGLQTKLTLGQPNDKYEQEADAVAARVMCQENLNLTESRVNRNISNAHGKRDSVARQEDDQDELHMKSSADAMQRQEDDQEELRMKPVTDVIQRQNGEDTVSNDDTDVNGAAQTFGFSDNEMERRLGSTPADGAETTAEDVELSSATESQLDEVEEETEGEPEQDMGEGELEGEEPPEMDVAGEGSDGETAAPQPAGQIEPGASPPPPDAAAAFENIVSDQVAEYLNGHVSPQTLEQLDPTTQALLSGANELSQREVVESEQSGSLLGNLTGVSPLIDAFTSEAPRGYAEEEPWLQTVARIRDIVSSLGGVVGMIGLVATVSGLILSLLIPPVGAFLLTAGRFCDIAALILDAIALVLNIILTGYNLYRLKNSTDPEEKRRLLGLVRQDAMQTVMSTIAVATAVAPGASKALANTRLGQAATRRMAAIASGAGSRLSAAGRAVSQSRFGRAVAGSAVGRGAVALGGGVSRRASVLRTGAANIAQSALVRARDTRLVRWANAAGGRLEERARNYFRGLATRNTRIGRFYNRRIRGFHERNVRIAESINDPIERRYQEQLGQRMNDYLESLDPQNLRGLSRAEHVQALNDNLRREFGDRVGHANVGVRRSGSIGFVRNDDILDQVRRQEFTEIQLIRDMNPGANAAELAEQVNRNPFIKGRWSEAEIAAFNGIHPNVRTGGDLVSGAVPKTPHHTIPAQMAPQIHQNPRFLQLVNDERFYGDFLRRAYPTSDFSRLPGRRTVRVPGARPGGTRQAANQREVMQGMVDRGDFTVPNRDFFESPQFLRELREQGSTGAWVNPRNPTESYLFNPHLVIGHNWNWQAEVASQIFDMNTRLGLRGEPIRQLLGPALRQGVRSNRENLIGERGVGGSGQASLNSQSMELINSVLARVNSIEPTGNTAEVTPESGGTYTARSQVTGGNSEGFLATLRGSMNTPVVTFAGQGAVAGVVQTPTPGIGGAVTNIGQEQTDQARPPPSPVPYSPQNLMQIRESRTSTQAAIETVQAFIAAAETSERDNSLAKQASEGLLRHNEQQQTSINTERQDIVGQQQNLDQSEGAQQNMSSEQSKASAESGKGQSQSEGVQSEGSIVSVEAKPEEPRKKSWLERAWDATAGAVWRRLVRPVIRAAKRKVNQVMKKINEFIMNMINQALGLDEIEAELNAGGSDIQSRRESLQETDSSLEENSTEVEQQHAQNQANAEQAENNITEAQQVRIQAEQLLEALLTHHDELLAQEEAGILYLQSFGPQYRDYFEQQQQLAEMEGQSLPASNAVQTEQAASEEEVITLTQVTPVLSYIESLGRSEQQSMQELLVVASQSKSSIAVEYAAQADEANNIALNGFVLSQSERGSRLAALRVQAQNCLNLPVAEGLVILEQILNDLQVLAEALEQERRGAMQVIEELHIKAMTAAAATES